MEKHKKIKALLESEERFKDLLDLTSEGIFIHNRGIAIDVNQSLLRMFNYTREETIGINLIKLLIPSEFHKLIKKELRKKTTKSHEMIGRKKDGPLFPIEFEARKVKDNDTCMIAIRDISERKQMVEADEQNRKFSKIIETTSQSVIITNIRGTVLYVNPSYYRFSGFIEAEVIGKSMFRFAHKMAAIKLAREVIPALLKKGHWQGDMAVVKKDKQVVPVDLICSLLSDEKNKPEYFVAIFSDVTKRKEAEEKIRMLASAVQQSVEGIAVANLDGIIQFVNPAWGKIHGYKNENLIGEHLHIFHTKEQIINEVEPFNEVVKKKGKNQGEVEHVRKDGATFPIMMTTTLLKDSTGLPSGLLAIARDITESKLLEQKYRQAQKMESLGTLAGGIAHDFNNILGAIIGYADMTQDDLPEESTPYKNLQAIFKAGIRAKDLVEQILTFSHQTETEVKVVQVDLILKEVLKLLKVSLPATIKVSRKINQNSGNVLADPSQLHQVFMNLCTNAYHAIGEDGGTLDISLDTCIIDGNWSKAPEGISEGTYLELRVQDSGCGMDKVTMERMFDPFFTTKKIGEGTGLGLSVVYGIVESLKGFITVDSALGKGTTFKLYLPRIEDSVSLEDSVKEIILEGKERILFVDDDKYFLNMGKQMLDRLGYQVTARSSSLEALELFTNKPEDFDLVLSDHIMPNMTGADLAKELLKIKPEIPIILITGFSTHMTPEKAKNIGIKGYVGKPITKHEIAKTIRVVLDKG